MNHKMIHEMIYRNGDRDVYDMMDEKMKVINN